ncbi:hypothetical protein ASPZODRAFT_77845, partial [Penicilliopsis zonata CBS 506.65]
ELPPISPAEPEILVMRGCQYGKFIADCDKDNEFAVLVVAFQKLVFCSYCVVMLRAGVSKKATNDMMRRYTGEKKDDLTLEKDRNVSRTPAQFGRFAAHDADGYFTVADRLGRAEIPPWEPGWMPYCLPCIVHHLTGYTVQ